MATITMPQPQRSLYSFGFNAFNQTSPHNNDDSIAQYTQGNVNNVIFASWESTIITKGINSLYYIYMHVRYMGEFFLFDMNKNKDNRMTRLMNHNITFFYFIFQMRINLKCGAGYQKCVLETITF